MAERLSCRAESMTRDKAFNWDTKYRVQESRKLKNGYLAKEMSNRDS